MKKRAVKIFFAITISLLVTPELWAAGIYGGGDGSEGNPFKITTSAHLDEMHYHSEDWDKNFVLTADIDMSAYSYTTAVIAPDTDSSNGNNYDGTAFTGTFDGNDKSINNLTINGAYFCGLFGQILTDSQINNLGMNNVSITATGISVGSLVADNYNGYITECYSNGTITGLHRVGGLVGWNWGSISKCFSACVTNGDHFVAGLVGENNCGSINDSYATGQVNGNGCVGGLVGVDYGNGGAGNDTIINCYATSAVNGDNGVGGLAGSIYNSTISNCYSIGNVTGNISTGGLIGIDDGDITIIHNSFWDTGTSDIIISDGGTPKSTSEMKTLSTFTDAGWDFSDTDGDPADWQMSSGDYPHLSWETLEEFSVPFSDTFNRADGNSIGSFWEELYPDNADLENQTAYLYGGNYDRPQIGTPQFIIDQSGKYVLEFYMKLQDEPTYNDSYYMFYLVNSSGAALFHVYANGGNLGSNDNYWWWDLHNSQWIDTGHLVTRNQWNHFKFIIDFGDKKFSGWRDGELIWGNLQFINEVTEFMTLVLSTGETSPKAALAKMWLDNVSFSEAPEFNSTSDVITNPWLGLFNVGDNYSLAGYGTFEGALRSYSLIGKETVLGVNCLVLHVEGHGENPITEYYDARIAQDTTGDLRVLKITGVDDGGGAFSWQASSADTAPIFIPANPQAGQVYGFIDGEYHEVIALDQTVVQMSTGMGPYSGCMQYNWNEGKEANDVDKQFHCPGIGIVKEIWDDDGNSNGWERIASTEISNPISWVYIDDDPGVSGHDGFTGFMSKYEITNAQYCKYLNAALVSGDITVDVNVVYGSGGEYDGEVYFETFAADSDSQIIYSDGFFTVRSRDAQSMADHPVVEVSWYGAKAFCDYYGYILPTEWQWQAVADFDGTFTYGCGSTIVDRANYNGINPNPLSLSSQPYTTPVDYYEENGEAEAPYGHGTCDMAGNVWEWTDSDYSETHKVVRGGAWSVDYDRCLVSYQYNFLPNDSDGSVGFRVCFLPPVDEYWNGWVGTNLSSHSPTTDSGQAYIAEETVSLEYTSEDGSFEKENMTIFSKWYDLQGWLNMHVWEEGGLEILQFLEGNNSLAYLHRQPDEDNDLGTTLLVKKALGASDADIVGEYGYFGHWQTVSSPSAASEFGTVTLDSDYTYSYSGYDSDSQPVSETGTWSFDPVNAVIDVNITGLGEKQLQAGQDGVLMHFDIDPIEDNDLGYSYLVKKGSDKTMQSVAGRYLYQEFSTDKDDNEPFTGWGILEFEQDGTWSIACSYNDGSTDTDSGTYTIDSNGTGTVHITNSASNIYNAVLSHDDQSITIALMGQDGDVGIGIAQRSSDCNGNGILDVFEIRGDIDGNGIVNFIDFAKFAEYWLEDNCGMCGCADMSCNGKVDMDDLSTFVDNWLTDAP